MAIRAVAGAALAVFLGATSIQAETTITAKSGNWQAFGGTTQNGTPVCGVSHPGDGKYFGLKLFSGEDTFTVQMGSAQWKIADKARVQVTMKIDSNPTWTAAGTGFHFPDGDAGIQFDINKNEVGRFMTEFRNGSQIRIQFQNSMLADWVLSLSGSSAVSEAFLKCNQTLK